MKSVIIRGLVLLLALGLPARSAETNPPPTRNIHRTITPPPSGTPNGELQSPHTDGCLRSVFSGGTVTVAPCNFSDPPASLLWESPGSQPTIFAVSDLCLSRQATVVTEGCTGFSNEVWNVTFPGDRPPLSETERQFVNANDTTKCLGENSAGSVVMLPCLSSGFPNPDTVWNWLLYGG